MVLAEKVRLDTDFIVLPSEVSEEVDSSLPTTAQLLHEMKEQAEERGFSSRRITGATLEKIDEFTYESDMVSIRQTVIQVKKRLAAEFGFDWSCLWDATFEHFVLVVAGIFESCYVVQTTPTQEDKQLSVYKATIPAHKLRSRN